MDVIAIVVGVVVAVVLIAEKGIGVLKLVDHGVSFLGVAGDEGPNLNGNAVGMLWGGIGVLITVVILVAILVAFTLTVS